ncbi:hypothetical protein GQ457_05G017670 [Hibiscus cannabinus]
MRVVSLKEDISGDALPCSWFGSKAIFGRHLRPYYQQNSGTKWTRVNGLRHSGIFKSRTLFGGPHGYALGGCGEESVALLFWSQGSSDLDSSYRLHKG